MDSAVRSPTPARRPTITGRRGCLFGCFALAATILFAPFQKSIRDGGFLSTEYRVTFVDEVGRPIPGVTLQVKTQAGGVCYVYPVDEFVLDQSVESDVDGRMVFHHVSDAVEFSGHESINLLGMSFGDPGAPEYTCVFRLGELEVHRVGFGELQPRGDWDQRPTVTRTWQHPDWLFNEYAAHRADWTNRRRLLFDVNGDGELDREERVAAAHFDRVVYDAEFDGRNRNVQFFVVKRTITISMP